MEKLIISGATGFIGGNFLNQYSDQFDQIYAISRTKKLNIKSVQEYTEDEFIEQNGLECEWGLYLTHDNVDLFNNIRLFRKFMRHCVRCKVKNIIVMSSFVVYDFISNEQITRNTPYTRMGEPYVEIKQKIEEKM